MFKNCPDCNVPVLHNHKYGCDSERCPSCGGQAMMCLETRNNRDFCTKTGEYVDKKDLIPWTGESFGVRECREYNLYCYWDEANKKWIQCDKNHPQAMNDLNTLLKTCTWNKKLKRFVKDE